MADERSRLGRGLATLMGDVGAEAGTAGARNQRKVPVEFLRANPRNPRRIFADAEIEELSASIRERGIIQPIVVRAVRGKQDAFEIIAGERRWRAAQRANQHEVPIVVLDVTDGEALELAIIENVQRTDLNPLEEATGYQSLANEFNHSQDDIAKVVGKSRSHIANTMRLLNLPERVKAYINSGKLTAGHARMLVGQPNAEVLADQIVNQSLNVRQVEAMVRKSAKGQARAVKRTGQLGKDADTEALESRLTNALGLLVNIDHRANGGGTLQVRYRTLEQLDDVIRRMESGPKIAAGEQPESGATGGPRIRRT